MAKTFKQCLLALSILLASCGTNVEVKYVRGTLDGPLAEDSLPTAVRQAIAEALRSREYEVLAASFPNDCHTREPSAFYDKTTGSVWLTVSAMAGTGVQVELLYQIRFPGDSLAVASAIDPYDIQLTFSERLEYAIDGDQMALYLDGKPLCTATNTLTDMGNFDDDALWIGEQITYDLREGQPRVCITPGVKFASSPMLFYDDMPTIIADMAIDEQGTFVLSSFRTAVSQ